MPTIRNNRILVVMAPHGAGGDAVAGVLGLLGARILESKELDDILNRHFAKTTLQFQGNLTSLGDELRTWLVRAVPDAESGCLVLQHPLLMLAAPSLAAMQKPTFLVVRRPYADIQATSTEHGEIEARILYKRLMSDLASLDMDYFDIDYAELKEDFKGQVARLAHLVGLNPDVPSCELAADLLKGLK